MIVHGRSRRRLPSLEQYDLSDIANYFIGSGRRVFTPRWTPAPSWPVLHCGGCWCGEPCGHDWPGRADGAPHPPGSGVF